MILYWPILTNNQVLLLEDLHGDLSLLTSAGFWCGCKKKKKKKKDGLIKGETTSKNEQRMKNSFLCCSSVLQTEAKYSKGITYVA